MTDAINRFPISQDPKTRNQVAGILMLRELRRIANGEPTEPERRARRMTTDALKMRAYALAAFLAVLALAVTLSGCGGTPATRVETVEVKVPVAVQPITPAQVPVVPGPLGPRPPTVQQAADRALAGFCEMVAYAYKADPLLRISAGEKPVDLPAYPECSKR